MIAMVTVVMDTVTIVTNNMRRGSIRGNTEETVVMITPNQKVALPFVLGSYLLLFLRVLARNQKSPARDQSSQTHPKPFICQLSHPLVNLLVNFGKNLKMPRPPTIKRLLSDL